MHRLYVKESDSSLSDSQELDFSDLKDLAYRELDIKGTSFFRFKNELISLLSDGSTLIIKNFYDDDYHKKNIEEWRLFKDHILNSINSSQNGFKTINEAEVPAYHGEGFIILYEGSYSFFESYEGNISEFAISALNPNPAGDIIFIDSDNVPENVLTERNENKVTFSEIKSLEDIQNTVKTLYFQADTEKNNQDPSYFAISTYGPKGNKVLSLLAVNNEIIGLKDVLISLVGVTSIAASGVTLAIPTMLTTKSDIQDKRHIQDSDSELPPTGNFQQAPLSTPTVLSKVFENALTTDEPTTPAEDKFIDEAVNVAPFAENDSYSVNEDGSLSVKGVLDNDTDIDLDPLTVILVTGPSDGTLTLNSDGSFNYTPDANFNGSDSFTYKANDGLLDSNTVTVNITVDPINDAPVATGDAYSVDEDNALAVNAVSGVLNNDTDIDGDTLNAVLVNGPSNGTLTLNADGSFAYTPNADFGGNDSFTYRTDDGSDVSNVATVTLNVNAIADLPSSNSSSISFDETDIIYTVFDTSSGDTELSLANLSTGTTFSVGSLLNAHSGIDIEALTFAEDGFLYGVESVQNTLVRIDPTNGNATQISLTVSGEIPNLQFTIKGMAADGNSLYAAGIATGGIVGFFEISLTTSTVSFIGGGNFGSLVGFAHDPISDKFYAAVNEVSVTTVYEVNNLTDGNPQNITFTPATFGNNQPILLSSTVEGISINSSGELMAIEQSSGIVYTYDLATGAQLIDNVWSPNDFFLDGPESIAVTSIDSYLFDGDDFTLSFSGTFSDFTDGSEEHYFLIMIPNSSWLNSGGTIVVNPSGFPAGTYVRVEADGLIDPSTGDAQGSVTLTASAGLSDPGYENVSFDVYAVAEEVNVPAGDPAGDNLAFQTSSVEIEVIAGDSLFLGTDNADFITGTTGNELMIGLAGNDFLDGGGGNDVFIGGPGSDTMRGGNGVDTFVWSLSDAGTVAVPELDTVYRFTEGFGGDRLDLSNLLQGEENNSLDDYLDFSLQGSDTLIEISSDGSGVIDQQVTLLGEDITAGGTLTDIQIIQNLLDNSQLVVDM